ncbi:NADH-quinone oxidoreductase subunit J [Cupriavidus basilensis]
MACAQNGSMQDHGTHDAPSSTVFALVLVLAALKVITAKNPVHSALFLVLSFFTAAAIWMLLEGRVPRHHCWCWSTLGAVMVLFLFVVMMIDIDIEHLRRDFWTYVPMAALVGAVIIARDGRRADAQLHAARPRRVQESPTRLGLVQHRRRSGKLIYTDYIYAFEVRSAQCCCWWRSSRPLR